MTGPFSPGQTTTLFAGLQNCFSVLTLGDVLCGAHHPPWSAHRIGHEGAAAMDPTHGVVGTDDTQLKAVGTAPSDSVLNEFASGVLIVGVDVVQPILVRDAVNTRFQPEDAEMLIRPSQSPGREVQFPTA